MNLDEAVKLFRDESNLIEKKSGVGDTLGVAISGFSNAIGGKIFVGVEDKGKLVGIDYNDSNKKKVNALLNELKNAVVHIETVDFEKGKVLLCVSVDEARKKPVYFKGVAYKRVNSENKVCSDEEVLKFQVDSAQIKFDGLPCRNTERRALLQDIDDSKVMAFVNQAKQKRNRNLSNGQRAEDVLSNLNLYNKTESSLNNAALLLFGKAPQEFLPMSSISFSAFSGEEISESFVKQTIVGDVFALLDNSVNLINQFSPPKSRIDGTKRIDVYPYPLEALRELIINAIVHRDYFTSAEITVRVFSNRIEIANPGEVPKSIDFNQLIEGKNNLSVRRNPLICEVLDYAGYMEKAGHGFNRVLSILEQNHLPKPEFPKIEGSFKAIIYAGTGGLGVQKATELNYNSGQMKVLNLVLAVGKEGISITSLIEKTGFSNVYISNLLKELEKEGQIKKKKVGRQVFAFFKHNN